MRPEPEDTTVRLPVTFDYHGGRSDNKKGNIIFAIVLFLIAIILTVMVVRGESPTGNKVIIITVTWIVVMLFTRFKIMREQTFSDAYETLKEIDNIPGTDSFWNIYEIESEYPYVCHFKDGKSGIFIRLEKDVVVGKSEDVLFRHFDAISEAYNLAGSSSINMCQIDYMDNVGNDARLQGLYEGLNDCENHDMKEALLSMYSNLQDEMSRNYASFDVYLFTCKGKEDQLWYNVKSIVDKLLCGNYLSFKALDIDGVRTTCMAIFNLNEFSAIEACENVVSTRKYKGIVPIQVEHYDGSVTEINKTQQRLREEAAERARLAEEAKKNKGRRGKKTSSPQKGVSKTRNTDKPVTDKPVTNKADDNKAMTESSDDLNLFD